MNYAEDTHAIIERLSGLYQVDPDKFEQESRAIIEQTIASFPDHHRRRAEGLQFKIDNSLRGYHDPVSRMNKMVEIFWTNFQQFHDVLHRPEEVLAERDRRHSAKIISLHPSLQQVEDA